jgi:hypothetical protein
MESLTKTIGTYIRDVLRADSTFKSIVGISSHPENYIFFTRPRDEVRPFANPRVVVEPRPSDADELRDTGIYRGTEQFQVVVWTDDKPYTDVLDAMDRVVTLFNKTGYTGTILEGNLGTFICTGKVSGLDPDKEKTAQGNIFVSLQIGGI